MISPSRLITTTSPDSLAMVSSDLNSRVPGILTETLDWAAIRAAVPPMWKVRRVSWVPGSPMDWVHYLSGGQVAAVALAAQAPLGLAG
jgi:hypothetical protein